MRDAATRRWSSDLRAGPTSSRPRAATSPHLLRPDRPGRGGPVRPRARRQAAATSQSWLPLGNLYCEELGDVEAAEEAYRSGIAAGDIYCHHNLGVLLADRGDLEGAVEQFRLGAAAGDELAASALRELDRG